MKNVVIAATMCLGFTGWQSLAEEDCRKEATAFVQAHSNDTAEQKWMRSQESRFEQKQKDDASCSCDSKAADAIFLGWIRDRKTKFDPPPGKPQQPLTEAERLEICRWYLLFKSKGWTIDADIGDFITKANFYEWVVPKIK